MLGAQERIGQNNQLIKLNQLIDWSKLRRHLKGLHKNEENFQGGPEAYDPVMMFKLVLLGQWHSLSDKQLEESLRVRLDFMLFTGFEVGEDMPDETTLCRFRNKLIDKKLDKKLFKMINAQLEQLGLQIQSAAGAIVDATVIESSARPRRTIIVADDRAEEEVIVDEPPVYIEESADADARWLKKGKRCYFGYKGFIRTTEKEGYIQAVHVTPANESELKQMGEMLNEFGGKRLYADKGYTCKENDDLLKKRKIKNCLMRKAARNRPLTRGQKLFNKMISKHRYRVEQAFGTLKRRFKFERASYLTKTKVLGQMYLKSMCFNLLKAVNQVQYI